jgi:REP element-mobilizing transposase RayT
MLRHPRVHAAGLVYHIMARGNNGQTLFHDRTDYGVFLKALSTANRRYPFSLYAYAVMPNHAHRLIEVRSAPTARIM